MPTTNDPPRARNGQLKDFKVRYRCGGCDETVVVTRAYIGDGRDPEMWIDGIDGELLACSTCEEPKLEFVESTGELADYET